MAEAHVRIDEGIKRGPKVQRRPGPGKLRRNPETGKVQAIPDGLDYKEVLARYLSEDTTSHIAQSYGVSRKSLTAWLRQVAPKEWKQVQIIRAHDQKEQGNEALQDESLTPDALSLARARELVRSAQWDLSALDDDYRPKLAVESKQVSDPATQELANAAIELLQRFKEKVVNPVPVLENNAPVSDSDHLTD